MDYQKALNELTTEGRQAVIDRVHVASQSAGESFRRYGEAVYLLRRAAKWMDETDPDGSCPVCGGTVSHDEGCLRDAIQRIAWPKVAP